MAEFPALGIDVATGLAGSIVAIVAVLCVLLAIFAFSRVGERSEHARALVGASRPGRARLLGRLRGLEHFILSGGIVTVAIVTFAVAHQLRQAETLSSLRLTGETERALLAESHVWLEEALQQDPTVDYQRDVHDALGHANAGCTATADTLNAQGWWAKGQYIGRVLPRLQQLCDRTSRLTALSVERWAARPASGAGTSYDSIYDAVFRAGIADLDTLKADLDSLAVRNRRLTAWLTLVLVVLLLLLGVVTIAVTVSSRRAIEADLYALEHLGAVVASSSDAIFSRELHGPILSWNAAAERMSGYSAEELVGKPIASLIPTGRSPMPELEAAARRVARGERVDRFEAEAVTKDGQRLSLSLSAAPIRDHTGAVTAMSLVARDMTASKRAERDLRLAKELAERANRAKSEFLSQMSHELRTPLNSVIGFTGVLLENPDGNLTPADVLYLERISSNGKHLLTLINQILDLAKIEAGKLEPELEPVAVDMLVRKVLDQLQETVCRKPLLLLAELPAHVAPIDADAGKLRQILINLVSNAIKFTEEGSVRVSLSVEPVSRRPVRIDVIDTGIGMNEDQLRAVFEPFEQAEQGIARRYGGTGLGLTISRSLADVLGYRLHASSSPGQGSTFTLLLQPDSQPEASAGADHADTHVLSGVPDGAGAALA